MGEGSQAREARSREWLNDQQTGDYLFKGETGDRSFSHYDEGVDGLIENAQLDHKETTD